MKMKHSVPKRRHIKVRLQGIAQKNESDIHNTAKVLNQEQLTGTALNAVNIPTRLNKLINKLIKLLIYMTKNCKSKSKFLHKFKTFH